VQQIDSTGLEARSDGRERGLLHDLDAIHGIAQRFELVQQPSIA
jgi:hypothetical protein